MARRLRQVLTYSNVMATIAVFIALGAGAYAAINLPANSVKSKHIGPGQVKPPDLSSKVRLLPIFYSKPIGTPLQTTILNKAGYKVVASCPDNSGEPNLQAGIAVPKDGSLDFFQGQVFGGPADLGVGRNPIDGGTLESITGSPGSFTPDPGEIAIASGILTYAAQGRNALIVITVRANDDNNRCEVTGALIPLA